LADGWPVACKRTGYHKTRKRPRRRRTRRIAAFTDQLEGALRTLAGGVLDRIVEAKARRLDQAKRRAPIGEVTAKALALEDEFREYVLEPIEWIGIDGLSRDWAIVRAVVRTAPLHQFALRHAINARVRSAFAEAGIALGAPIPGVP